MNIQSGKKRLFCVFRNLVTGFFKHVYTKNVTKTHQAISTLSLIRCYFARLIKLVVPKKLTIIWKSSPEIVLFQYLKNISDEVKLTVLLKSAPPNYSKSNGTSNETDNKVNFLLWCYNWANKMPETISVLNNIATKTVDFWVKLFPNKIFGLLILRILLLYKVNISIWK